MPQPHSPTPTSAGHTDPVQLAYMLGMFFIPAMYVCFALGLEGIAKWLEERGSRLK